MKSTSSSAIQTTSQSGFAKINQLCIRLQMIVSSSENMRIASHEACLIYEHIFKICEEEHFTYLGMFFATCYVLKYNQTVYPEIHALCMKYYNYFKNPVIEVDVSETGVCTKESEDDSIIVVDDIDEEVEQFDGINSTREIKVQLLCNWMSSVSLSELWNKMSKGNFKWNKIRLVWDEPPDYWVIINKPPSGVYFDCERTVVFQMEPLMNSKNTYLWGEWSSPPVNSFLRVVTHQHIYNNLEWHLSKTYNELINEHPVKNSENSCAISTILSAKYSDPGHKKRVDFVKYIENELDVHVYGDNRFEYVNYCGSLPYHEKERGLYPYKYTFNAENHSIENYFTEKLVDAILSECLCFYHGCPNISKWIHPQAYIQLELIDFESDMNVIRSAIENNEWKKRIGFIRKEKERILNDLQFFPRLEHILSEL